MKIERVKQNKCDHLYTHPGKKIQPGKPRSSEIYLHLSSVAQYIIRSYGAPHTCIISRPGLLLITKSAKGCDFRLQ